MQHAAYLALHALCNGGSMRPRHGAPLPAHPRCPRPTALAPPCTALCAPHCAGASTHHAAPPSTSFPTGYYPKLFYPKIGKIAESFIPNFTTAYYIKARPASMLACMAFVHDCADKQPAASSTLVSACRCLMPAAC